MRYLILLFLFITNLGFAQNSRLKWQFNAGVCGQKFMNQNLGVLDNLQEFSKLNVGFPLNHMTVSRHLFGGFSPELKFGTNTVAVDPTTSTSKYLLVNGLLNLKYSLANGYLFSQNSFIEPFLKGGGGMTYLDDLDNDKFKPTYDFGGGFAIWPTKNRNFGIQVQQLYHMIPMYGFQQTSRDYFEYSASLAYKFGLKDKDKDGTPDEKDECPDKPGPKNLKGCPDKDGDGIADKDDRCPDDKGPVEFNGCPDKDGDSIPDIDDKCPDVPGLRFFAGCPDADNDSIPDYQDSCPKVKGVRAFNGCPDRDNDGIEDKLDACPDTPGVARFQGCPDRDNDSVPDAVDACPDVPGPPANNGCPDENKRKAVESDIAFRAKSIFFASGKHTLLKQSFPMLDEIMEIMKANPNEIFVIEGHTDNVGGEMHNLSLSKQRANSVKDYFKSKGINPDAMLANGFGQKYPLADNRNTAGRAKNRRTDITIKR